MKLVDPKVKLLPQAPGLGGVFKQIELVGRTCYKSENKITEDSAKPFVDRMIASKHYAMLEHGTIYLMIPVGGKTEEDAALTSVILDNKYTKWVPHINASGDIFFAVTTNYRVIIENSYQKALKWLSEPSVHIKRICLKFNTDIGVSREGNRHRVFSIAEQSTRYCNYSKEKFGSELTFLNPFWDITPEQYDKLTTQLKSAEKTYMDLINLGCKPQEARIVLPLDTATEVVYTAFEDDWKHFFDLRMRGLTGKPHPSMQKVAEEAHKLIKNNLNIDL